MLVFFIFGRWAETIGASSPQERDQILCLRSANGPGWGLLLTFEPPARLPWPCPACPAPHPSLFCVCSVFIVRLPADFTLSLLKPGLFTASLGTWLRCLYTHTHTHTHTQSLSFSTHRCMYMYVSIMYMYVCIYIHTSALYWYICIVYII